MAIEGSMYSLLLLTQSIYYSVLYLDLWIIYIIWWNIGKVKDMGKLLTLK